MHHVTYFQAASLMSSFLIVFAGFPCLLGIVFYFCLKPIVQEATGSRSALHLIFAIFAVSIALIIATAPTSITDVLNNPAAKILSATESNGHISVVVGTANSASEVKKTHILGQEVEVKKTRSKGDILILDEHMIESLSRIGYTIANVPIAEAVKVASTK